MFGGNSSWRGPVWMPVNALIIRAILLVAGLNLPGAIEISSPSKNRE
jgi:hypothetical protein